VTDIATVFSVGEHIRCVVIKVDVSDGSIQLSTKMLEDKAGDMLNDREALFQKVGDAATVET